MTQETADVLRRAKALIDTPEKWSLTDVGTAIVTGMEAWGDIKPINAYEALKRALRLTTPLVTIPITEWEAEPVRTHAEVMEAFDKAIAAEEATP